jgi:hypothetical protein
LNRVSLSNGTTMTKRQSQRYVAIPFESGLTVEHVNPSYAEHVELSRNPL